MIKAILGICGALAFGVLAFALSNGAPIVDAFLGGATLFVVFAILGFFFVGAIAVLHKFGGYLSAGVLAALLLFWQHILPAVCVNAICYALGISG